jgi:hypothetical protein
MLLECASLLKTSPLTLSWVPAIIAFHRIAVQTHLLYLLSAWPSPASEDIFKLDVERGAPKSPTWGAKKAMAWDVLDITSTAASAAPL